MRVASKALAFCLWLGLISPEIPLAAPSAETEPSDSSPQAVEESESGGGSERRSMMTRLRQDGGYLVTFPKRRTPQGIARTAAVLGGIAGLVVLDENIRNEIVERRTDDQGRLGEWFEPLGRSGFDAIAAALVYAGGRLSGREKLTETGRCLGEALLFTQLFTGTAKAFFGGNAPGSDRGFFTGGFDFPSGHTSRAFVIATVLAQRHGKTVAWIAYPLASLVGVSRVYADQHWASDVVAGAVLGYALGKAVVRLRATRHGGVESITLSPVVLPGSEQAGFVLSFRF